VSNALKPQKRTSITGLSPATQYVVKLEAHNIAGFSTEEFVFMTLTKDGDVPPPNLMKQGHDHSFHYSDIRFIITLLALITTVIILIVGAVLCLRHRQSDLAKEQLDNQQNAEAQRERYYATIHKAALQPGDKIPETSEDISPYATFQLSEPSTLPQNTMLHSFMYHEHPMTEGCASPPPSSSVPRTSPYYNIQKFQSTKGHGRRRSNRKNDADSEESDSDLDQLTAAAGRSESSTHNQLEIKRKQNVIYHGALSNTSSDVSPMSDQKSLPRRNRSRLLAQGRSPSQRQMLPHLSVAETTFTETRSQIEQNTSDRLELSEAECDIDTLKKLKLGLKSSLWSKPNGSGQATDYSIAV
jgi:Tfp pilus assembly protein PilE